MSLIRFVAAQAAVVAFSIPGAEEKPRAADAFVDSIGVNIHLGYTDTVYNNYDEILKPRLIELGVRHVRDGLRLNRKDVIKKLSDLAESGIRSNLILRSEEAAKICKEAESSVESVEGENEPDAKKHANKSDWIALTKTESKALYENIKGDPKVAQLPVLVSGMANTRNSPGELGDMQTLLDVGNMHSYPGGLNPTSGGWGIALTKAIEQERKVCGDNSIIATETGYHNDLNARGHPGVPEEVAAKYIPRLLLHYFNSGFKRTYLYEFLDLKPDPQMTDMEKHFGLLRNDGTPKPAFSALKKLIDILKDPGEAFEPKTPVNFLLHGAPADLEKTILQKRDDRVYLLLWREVLSYDSQSKTAIDVKPVSVQIGVDKKTPFRKAIVRSLTSDVPDVTVEAIDFISVNAELTDTVTIIEFVP